MSFAAPVATDAASGAAAGSLFGPVGAIVGAGLGLVAGGVSAYGTYESGQASGKAAAYSAQVAKNNAIIAEQNADYAEKAGASQATVAGMKAAAAGGRLKASQAANGVDVNSGSAVEVQSGERKAGLLDTATMLNNSELAAYGYRSQATNSTAQGGLDTLQAKQAPIGADFAAAGGLLGSASGVASKWSQFGPQPAATGGGPSLAPGSLY